MAVYPQCLPSELRHLQVSAGMLSATTEPCVTPNLHFLRVALPSRMLGCVYRVPYAWV